MNTFESPLLGLSQRLPPANIQAEQALLGALLANNRAFERVADFLQPEHFADPVHGRIYQAIARRVDAGNLADAITLKAEFEHAGVLDEVGGVAYLGQLLSAMVGIINAGEYGRAIYDAWMRRQLIDIGETVVNNAFGAEPELDGRKQVEVAEQSLFDLTNDTSAGGFVSFERALTNAIEGAERAFHRTGHVSGLTTGLRDLDAKTGGMHPSDLLILAGRPGMGKTALATKIAFGAARALLADARADRRRTETPGGGLLAGNERRAARHPSAQRGGAGLRRPHPPRRYRPAGFRPLRAGQPRNPGAAAADRRHAGAQPVGLAHPLPPARSAPRGWRSSSSTISSSCGPRSAPGRRTACWKSARSPRA